MTKRSQEINSGNYSNNFQGDNASVTYIINQFDENKAKQISEYSAKQVMREYFSNADELAQKRMAAFENKFIPKLAEIENALEVFNDPAFKIVYRRAQIQAATTSRESDYNILSELLVHRYKKQDNKNSCIGINGAIDIVEQISDESLTALSILVAIDMGVYPTSPNITNGLGIMNDLFQHILTSDLPNGKDWLDQLDILRAIRIDSSRHFKKLNEFYLQNMDGYLCVGIDKNSDNYQHAIDILKQFEFESMLVENELIENHVRLQLDTMKNIDNLCKVKNGLQSPLSEEEKESIHKVIDLYDKDENKIKLVKNNFYQKLDTYPVLKTIHEWWDKIPYGVSITSIGRVLGHANAQRCYTKFPPLD